MKNKSLLRRVLALALAVVMLTGFAMPAGAVEADNASSLKFTKADGEFTTDKLSAAEVEEEAPLYADDEIVRVSIVLDKESTIAAGFATAGIANNDKAMEYRASLQAQQNAVSASIERNVLDNKSLNVVWNLTLAANLISAEVAYGDIEAIAAIDGVKEVVIETQYEPMVVSDNGGVDPNMATSGEQIGSLGAWAAGYTGAGSRIAIIDTGADLDHQSFDAGAFDYSLAQLDGEYDLLDAEEIAGVLDKLNAGGSAEDLYVNSKIPFGFNYIDGNLIIDHDHDSQGGHGSHVAGIAAANAYIPDGQGGYAAALDTVATQGVAPDAQLIVMKVFGASGGAYDSDYMAAIEDAILLGADSVNLSLGTGNPGFARCSTYQDIMDMLSTTDTVVVMSAGNSYGWADQTIFTYLMADDVSMQTGGAPGSYTNSLGVASVDNDGATGYLIYVDGKGISYSDTSSSGYKNEPLTSIAGDHEFVLFENVGVDEAGNNLLLDYADEVAGKIVLVSRGTSSFYQKHQAAAEAGAVACIVYNNQAGIINMDLSDSTATIPCVSITQADGATIKAAAEAVEIDGAVAYYTGTITISDRIGSTQYGSDYYTMSEFSSWGVPGSLEMKPEITAPGGSIYSVDGEIAGGQAYIVMSGTSMAAPQVSGMVALVAQYIKEQGLDAQEEISARALAQSLLMSTAEPVFEAASGGQYYSVLKQGAGLANVGNAVASATYILMNEDATGAYADGKVKVELGDDPARTGSYNFSFSVNNMTEEAQSYTMSADLFTQDVFYGYGELLLDTWTALMNANTTFTVNGSVLSVEAMVDADVDCDGDTDVMDAQAILEYTAGNNDGASYDLAAADVDADGQVATYDAHLILKGIQTSSFEVPANGKVEVSVSMELTDNYKAFLNTYYVNGAYVEGYVYVNAVSTGEGELGVSHSIPVLGFYGNWSDASMYDRVSFIEYLYDQNLTDADSFSYLSEATGSYWANNLVIRYPGDKTNYSYTINPYMLEDTLPAGRGALSSDVTLYQQQLTLIRNASALAAFAMDQDGNVLYLGKVTDQAQSAFYYVNGQVWRNTSSKLSIGKKISALGAEEGDVITAGVVAVPEYYETNGAITEEQLKALIAGDTLGEGAFLTNTFVVDDTAPVLLDVTKSLVTGDLTITAQDTNYIAAVAVLDKNGARVYDMGIPAQTAANEKAQYEAKVGEAGIGEFCTIMIADYAGNEAYYTVEYGGEPENYTGRMIAFTQANVRGSGSRWIEITPDELYYNSENDHGGVKTFATSEIAVSAAEYVGGYVFFCDYSGMIYVAELDNIGVCYQVGSCAKETGMYVIDMAYSYAENKMYGLTGSNTLIEIDLKTGNGVGLYDICPISNYYWGLNTLAIDMDGNFYATEFSSGEDAYFFTWTLDQHLNEFYIPGEWGWYEIEGVPTGHPDLCNEGEDGSLAWDHDKGILYFASSTDMNSAEPTGSYLWVIDPETGAMEKANGEGASQLEGGVDGLFIVPSKEADLGFEPGMDTDITHIEVSTTWTELMQGATYQVGTFLYPWYAADKSLTWASADETIASVDQNGLITGINPGRTTITVTSNRTPSVSRTIHITVKAWNNVDFSGLIYNPDGKTAWGEFSTSDLANWTEVAKGGGAYIGGTLHEGELIVHTGDQIYGIDPDTFDTTSYGSIASSWIWSDAAESPALNKYFGDMMAICNGGQYLEMINVAEGTLSYFDLTEQFSDDPMATIALYSSRIEPGLFFDTEVNEYYMMTESGVVHRLLVEIAPSGNYRIKLDYMYRATGTGIDLTGVSSVTGGQYASMIYDKATGYLVLSSYMEGEYNDVYIINPKNGQNYKMNDLGEGYWPLVSLYQYDRPDTLTLKIDPAENTIYTGDTFTITTKVINGENGVTYVSSDETVATVDANGVVTGVGEGTATITVTTVDTNEAGEQISMTCDVTVLALADATGSVKAQLHTDSGAEWVTIDLSDMSYTVDGKANVTLTGGGYANEALYGSTVDMNGTTNGVIYKIDAATFAETAGSGCSPSYAPRDMADAPLLDCTYTADDGTVYSYEAFGMPIYLGNNDGTYFLADYQAGSLMGWNASYKDVAAIAYAGALPISTLNSLVGSTIAGIDETCYAHAYYILTSGGDLYNYFIAGVYSDGEVGYNLYRGKVGNIGRSFSDVTALSADVTAEGMLIIADMANGVADLHLVDLTADTLETVKIGMIEGSTGIAALYGAADVAASTNAIETMVDNVQYVVTVGQAQDIDQTPVVPESEETDRSVARQAMLATAAHGDQSNGSLNAFVGQLTDNEDQYELSITADEAATNGKYTVTYDPAEVELVGVAVNAEYKAVNTAEEGTVVITFAGTGTIAADSTVAVLTFKLLSKGTSDVTVTTDELNDTYPGSSEDLTIGNKRPAGPGIVPTPPMPPVGPSDPVDPADPAEPQDKTLPFIDVKERDWFYNDVKYVYENGLMNGISETEFAPNGTMSRAMVVTVLYRMDGAPAVSGTNSFTDLTASWYKDAVQWAVENGITNGISETEFAPNAKVTREQFVTFLYRYAQYKGMDVSAGEDVDLSSFADGKSVSAYAVSAIKWAVAEGIIQGSDKGLEPTAGANRAQAAAILHRFLED